MVTERDELRNQQPRTHGHNHLGTEWYGSRSKPNAVRETENLLQEELQLTKSHKLVSDAQKDLHVQCLIS